MWVVINDIHYSENHLTLKEISLQKKCIEINKNKKKIVKTGVV